MRNLTSAVILSIGFMACGGESVTPTPEPPGPPTLKGRVVTEENYALPNAELLLTWDDFSQGGNGSASLTTARAPVEALSPWRFSLTVPGAPPDAVYSPDVEPRWGTRFAGASFVLVEPGTDIHRYGAPGIIAWTANYVLTYSEGNGEAHVPSADGGPDGKLTIAKGFTLIRQDTIRCADGYDQGCIDRKIAMGLSEAWAKSSCAIKPMSITHTVEVPADTELILTVRDPNAPPRADFIIPCP